ncbi:hypothetical protein ATANTOWER_025461 [Ataeniobius toweri]|uniref:Uncharacterized protein n=1 Tax=Ataeniobius toweri TaxID=208326 RepID=A0ABU7CIZ7_9TELE|nr:hypothetical protein [Ataeniobius toweri]
MHREFNAVESKCFAMGAKNVMLRGHKLFILFLLKLQKLIHFAFFLFYLLNNRLNTQYFDETSNTPLQTLLLCGTAAYSREEVLGAKDQKESLFEVQLPNSKPGSPQRSPKI